MESKIGTAVCRTARTVVWEVGGCESRRQMPSMISIYLLPDCPKGTSTVWATDFSVAQTVKTVAQTVWRDWATAKSAGETGKFAVDTVKLS